MIVPVHDDALELTIQGSTEAANADRRSRGERNQACWQARAEEIYRLHRGRHICFAGGEFFVADSAKAARKLAQQAHPEDDAALTIYVSKQRMLRVYANQRRLVDL